MAKTNEAEAHFYRCLRVAIAAFVRGSAPILSIEFARRSIPAKVRPTFQEMEASCKRKAVDAAPAPPGDAAPRWKRARRSMPEPENSAAPIIVIKKKVNHAGHHGGAWKVAYADVTAMMALFIVLWLLNTNDKVKKAVESYFKDLSGSGKQMGSAMAGVGESVVISEDDMHQLRDKLEQAMKTIPMFQQMKNNVELTITNEGLRVELLENEKGMFFQSGNASPTENGKELLVRLAEEIGKLPNTILVEGHTDAKPYSGGTAYSNWEPSADRANSARRLIQISGGLRPDQVAQVRGFADQHLRTPKDSTNASNRRISGIIQYLNAPHGNAPFAEKAKAGEGEPHAEIQHESKPHGEKIADAKPAGEKPPEAQPAPATATEAKKPELPPAKASH